MADMKYYYVVFRFKTDVVFQSNFSTQLKETAKGLYVTWTSDKIRQSQNVRKTKVGRMIAMMAFSMEGTGSGNIEQQALESS